MPTTPTTAPTAEDRVKAAIREWLAAGRLAAILDDPALFEKEIAAMLRQHSAPLEAQIAELTAERDASEAKRKDADREWTKHYYRMTRAEAASVAANATVAAIADDLCCEASRDEIAKAIVALQGERNGLRDALSASLDREMAMREALEPFAKAANLWDGPPGVCYHDSLQLWQTNGPVDYLTCGDLRAARATLQTKEDGNGR